MAKIRVRYRGIADERVIRATDLAKAGIRNVTTDLVWSRRNHWRLDLPGSKALEELLVRERHFTIESLSEPARGEPPAAVVEVEAVDTDSISPGVAVDEASGTSTQVAPDDE